MEPATVNILEKSSYLHSSKRTNDNLIGSCTEKVGSVYNKCDKICKYYSNILLIFFGFYLSWPVKNGVSLCLRLESMCNCYLSV